VHPTEEALLCRAYRAFNERDLEAALTTLHPEVDWPNAWEGGRIAGRQAVADYWARQFATIASTVEPVAFAADGDGAIDVTVHQVVRDAELGQLLSDSTVVHRYRIDDGLIVRMDVLSRA
jgi:ketosteroid isomerase-like protein